MAHVRKQVRDAVIARVTGLTTTASRVYASRVDPLSSAQVPALTIRNGAEIVQRASLGSPNPYVRRTQSVVIGVHATGDDVWDTIDVICAEVEVAMLGSQTAVTLGGLAIDTELQGIDAPRVSGEGATLVASVEMMFQVLLNAREGIPDAVIT